MPRRKNRMTLKEAGTAGFLVLVIVWLGFLVVGIFHKEQIARTTVRETRAEYDALETRRKELAATVGGLETERGQEASLRETYGVAKPGEEVIILVEKEELPPPPEPTFWDKVKDFLGL